MDEYREDNREERTKNLTLRCYAAKNMFKEAKEIVGIATSKYIKGGGHAQDLIYMYLPEWSEDDAKFFDQMQKELGYFTNPELKMKHFDEYPK